MDYQRKPARTKSSCEAFESTLVVGVAMRDHDRSEIRDANPEDVKVPTEDRRGEPAVVKEGAAIPINGYGHESREAVLGKELVAIAPVRRPIPRDAGRIAHEDVDEAVDDHRHLDPVDGHEGDRRLDSHRVKRGGSHRVRQRLPPGRTGPITAQP